MYVATLCVILLVLLLFTVLIVTPTTITNSHNDKNLHHAARRRSSSSSNNSDEGENRCPLSYTSGLKNNTASNIASSKILIVTYDDRIEKYQDYSSALNKKYCEKFNLFMVDYSKMKKHIERSDAPEHKGSKDRFNMFEYDHIPPWWRKVFIVKKAMHDHPQFDYIMWMDKDACFTKNEDVRKLIHDDDTVCIASIDPYPPYDKPNAGVFLIKNNDKGKRFIDEWLSLFNPKDWCRTDAQCNLEFEVGDGKWRTSSEWAGDSYEQGAMGKLTKKYNIKLLPTCVLAHCSDNTNDSVLVTHLMSHSNESRMKIFKEIDDASKRKKSHTKDQIEDKEHVMLLKQIRHILSTFKN